MQGSHPHEKKNLLPSFSLEASRALDARTPCKEANMSFGGLHPIQIQTPESHKTAFFITLTISDVNVDYS